MEEKTSVVFSRNVVEFVTVAAEFCAYVEQSVSRPRTEFVDTLLKILPLLYLKASMLPALDDEEAAFLEQPVTEDDYEYVRTAAQRVLGGQDDYLDVFVEDMKYSDTPVKKNISEDLADIYQDVRNFVAIYKQGVEDTMLAAVAAVRENFGLYWGQTLVNTMRALHDVRYNQTVDEETEPDAHDGDHCHCHQHNLEEL